MSADGPLDAESRSPPRRLRLPSEELATPATVAVFLRRQGVDPYAWSNGPGDRYAVHDHGYTKLLMCAAGSIVFELDRGERIALHPGEGFVLPPRTRHSALVGPGGCTCLEGHREGPTRTA